MFKRQILTSGDRLQSLLRDRAPAARYHLALGASAESQKSEDEIAAILREEDPDFYVKDEAYTRPMLSTAIYLWRINHAKVITDDAIYVEHPSGGYFRPAVTSIDFDLEMMNAFIDAFLFACFGRA